LQPWVFVTLQQRWFGGVNQLNQLSAVIFTIPPRLADLPQAQDVFWRRTEKRSRIAIDLAEPERPIPWRSMITGIRSWIPASRRFASVVMVAKV